ncbi:MAG: hypothetical protein ABSG45_04385 [Nitrososphaerales archaeon]|jgi:hypothetical protein
MSDNTTDLFILYQMGASEDWTWFSVVGIFLSEAALRDHAKKKGIISELDMLEPSASNEVFLAEPREFVAVKSHEGAVPDVELAQLG